MLINHAIARAVIVTAVVAAPLALTAASATAAVSHRVALSGAQGSGCHVGGIRVTTTGDAESTLAHLRYAGFAAAAAPGGSAETDCMVSLEIKPDSGWGYRVTDAVQQWARRLPPGAQAVGTVHAATRGTVGFLDSETFAGPGDGGFLFRLPGNDVVHGCGTPTRPFDLTNRFEVDNRNGTAPASLGITDVDGLESTSITVDWVRCP